MCSLVKPSTVLTLGTKYTSLWGFSSNIEVCKNLLTVAKKNIKIGKKVKINFIKDRPGHDKRYAVNSNKIKREIKWKNKVHEVLNGHKTFSALPSIEGLALYHPKTIDRQEKQNAHYNTL